MNTKLDSPIIKTVQSIQDVRDEHVPDQHRASGLDASHILSAHDTANILKSADSPPDKAARLLGGLEIVGREEFPPSSKLKQFEKEKHDGRNDDPKTQESKENKESKDQIHKAHSNHPVGHKNLAKLGGTQPNASSDDALLSLAQNQFTPESTLYMLSSIANPAVSQAAVQAIESKKASSN